MTDLTGKLIANTYKDILTINSSATNEGLDNTLRRVQDGEGTNSSLKLSETSAAFTGNVSVNGNLTINGAFQPQNIQTSAVRATTVSATNITTDVLTAGTLTFQDVSVSTLRAGTVSATTINAGSTLTVDGDNIITSAVAVSTAAILRAQIATTIANTSAALQANINVVSVGLSATNTQTQINATQIGLAQTSIAANASAITVNASAITVNSDAITSINSILASGTFASAGTSVTLEARIAGVSAALASTSAALTSNINTVSATLSIANVSIAANSSQIAANASAITVNASAITAINTIATNAMPKSGGAFTGEVITNGGVSAKFYGPVDFNNYGILVSSDASAVFKGRASFQGSGGQSAIQLGTASTQYIDGVARWKRGLIPTSTATYDFGNDSLRWNKAFITEFIGGINAGLTSVSDINAGDNSSKPVNSSWVQSRLATKASVDTSATLQTNITANTSAIVSVNTVLSAIQTSITANASVIAAVSALTSVNAVAITSVNTRINAVSVTMAASIDNQMPKSGGTFTGDVLFADGQSAKFVNSIGGDNLIITGITSTLGATGTLIQGKAGVLNIKNDSNIKLSPKADELGIVIATNSAVDLYYNNSKKLATTSIGIYVSGAVSATSFYGDGSNLTGIPATGASVGTSATLETRIAAVSALTSVNAVNIAAVSALTSINLAAIASVNTIAVAALPKAGGTVTGDVSFQGSSITLGNSMNDIIYGSGLFGRDIIPSSATDRYLGAASRPWNFAHLGAVVADNITVSGTVSATSFYGDGSNLTNIPATGASVDTSATLETRIAAVSLTMATSIGNSNTNIAAVSVLTSVNAAAITSVNTRINAVSVLTSVNAVNIAAVSALTSVNAAAITSVNTRINAVSVLTSVNAVNIAAVSVLTSVNAVNIAAVSVLTSVNAAAITSVNTRITTLSATMATSIGNSNSAITALSATMATSVATRLALAGGTMTGNLILNADPSASLQAASKQYVDNLTASSIHVHEAVRVETNSTNLNATYNNGSSGVGATLTNAGTQAALAIDGVTLNTSDRVLVTGQTNQTQNGVYVVTNTGSGSTNWILTRSDDADTSGDGSPDALDEGSYFFVQEGTIGAAHAFVCNTQGTIVFGTTNITFAQFSDSVEYTAGTGINVNASRVISTSGVPTTAQLAAVSATMATSIGNSNTNIAAVSVLTKTNKDAITSINSVLGTGAFASAGTSATLQTKINAVSVLTSVNAVNIAAVSVLTSVNAVNIAAVSVLTKTNKDAITSVNTRINAVSVLTSVNAVNIAAVSVLTSVNAVNIAAVSVLTSVNAAAITSVNSIATNAMPLAGGTFTGQVTFNNNGFTVNSNASAVFNGPIKMNSSILLGNSSTDTITGAGRWGSSLIPTSTAGRNLGNDSLRWDEAYINTFRGGIDSFLTSVGDINAGDNSSKPVNSSWVQGRLATKASVGTSATLETRIATVSSTMATSIANVSATLESRIAAVSAAIPSVGIDKYYYTATNGQTTFSGADTEGNTLSYTGDNLTVTLNGLSLDGISDYTASNGTSVVLAAGATTSDEVNIVVFNGAAASGSLPSAGGTITGDLEVNGALTVDGNTVWHNGNDAVSFTQNGYQTLPNGLMIQWGQRNTTSQTGSITFPTTFTTACWMVQVTSNYTLDKFGSTVTGKSTTSFNYRVGGNYVSGTDLYWIAIGK